VGCLGRALTILGIVWIGIIVLGGIGLLSDLEMTAGFLAGIGGSIIPGLLLLTAGRALRRRAKTMEPQAGPVPGTTTQPQVPEKRVPTSRSESPTSTGPTTIPNPLPPRLPAPQAPKPPVKPAPVPVEPVPPSRRDVTRRLEEAIPPLDDDPTDSTRQNYPMALEPPPPKTSQELIDEARKKWGRSKPR